MVWRRAPVQACGPVPTSDARTARLTRRSASEKNSSRLSRVGAPNRQRLAPTGMKGLQGVGDVLRRAMGSVPKFICSRGSEDLSNLAAPCGRSGKSRTSRLVADHAPDGVETSADDISADLRRIRQQLQQVWRWR